MQHNNIACNIIMALRTIEEIKNFAMQSKVVRENGNLPLRNALKFDFMISLQNIVSAKIIGSLWLTPRVRQEIEALLQSGNVLLNQELTSWKKIESIVVAQIHELHLPTSMVKMLSGIVPLAGDSLLNWIRYHDEHIFCSETLSKDYAAGQIGNIKWSARGTVNYAETAKSILANPSCSLTDDYKFKLACTFCLEDEIITVAPLVINDLYLKNVMFDTHPMVYFWAVDCTSDFTDLSDAVSLSESFYWDSPNVSTHEIIFKLLISEDGGVKKTFNEVPIRYMWDKLNDYEKADNIVTLFRTLEGQDLKFSLLNTLDYESQQHVFEFCSDIILADMLNDRLWEEQFLSTALHVMDVINPRCYLYLLQKLFVKLKYNSQDDIKNQDHYKMLLKQVWVEAPGYLRDFVFDHNYGFTFESLFFLLSWDLDMDLIKTILKHLNFSQKKTLIFGERSINQCSKFILENKMNFLDSFINLTLCSAEDVCKLKEYLIELKGHSIVKSLLEHDTSDQIEYYLSWAIPSDEIRNEYRKDLFCLKCFDKTFNSIVVSDKIDFTELEKHFKWCAKDSQEAVKELKSRVFQEFSAVECMRALIESGKYELLNQVLNWCLLDDQLRIAQFKKNLHQEDHFSSFNESLIISLIIKDKSCKLLDKFIEWSLSSEQEIEEFKLCMLYPHREAFSNDGENICLELLSKGLFGIADIFIKWCVTDPIQITEFKNKLLSPAVEVVRFLYGYEDKSVVMKRLIKFLNPSKEMVEELNNKLGVSPDQIRKFLQ